MSCASTVRGSDGQEFNLCGVPITMTYNSDGTIATATCTVGPNTYRRTYTYTSGNLTSITAWVKQ